MGHFLGQLHFRRISQGGVFGLTLIMTLLVVNLWGHTQKELKFTEVVNTSTSIADLSDLIADLRAQMTILIACHMSGNCYM